MPYTRIATRYIRFQALSYRGHCPTKPVVENSSKYFAPISPDLPEAEQAACAKRQQHAEWGVAVSRLGGIDVEPELLQELQRYINGELSLAELVSQEYPAGQPAQVYRVVARRAQFAG